MNDRDAMVIAFVNQKGGVGKTTTVFQVARAAARRGMATLAVDLDPQGNLTAVATYARLDDARLSLADALSDRVPTVMGEVIVPGAWELFDVAPTVGDALAVVRNELVIAGAGRESRLKTTLSPVRAAYDVILIDCPPSLDQLTVNGLVAADSVVIVTQPKMFSAMGFAHVIDTIRTVKTHYSPSLRVAGVLVNQYEAGTIEARNWMAEIHAMSQECGVRCYDRPVPKRVLISEATSAGRGLDQVGPGQGAELAGLYSEYLQMMLGV